MLFRAALSVAVLACASHVAAEPQPYRPAMMPVLGMSLMRRDTSGYQPEQTVCGAGDTCEAACGSGYTTCASHDSAVHCYDPSAQQSCCSDGSGNSCDAGYYCTNDSKSQTWCCPDSMDLTACAAAYSIAGGLHTPSPTSTTVSSSSTMVQPSSTSVATTQTYVRDTMTSVSTMAASSSGYTTAWTGANTTISSAQPTQMSITAPVSIVPTTSTTPAKVSSTGAAVANGVNAVALMAAGLLALL